MRFLINIYCASNSLVVLSKPAHFHKRYRTRMKYNIKTSTSVIYLKKYVYLEKNDKAITEKNNYVLTLYLYWHVYF